MVDPVIHAKMTMLVQDENDLEEEASKLNDELPIWESRILLATKKGMDDLAAQATQRVAEMKARKQEIKVKLEVIDMEKGMLRYESRRPSGNEVERAEALLESIQAAGLVDPEEARLERELAELKSDVELDFGDDSK